MTLPAWMGRIFDGTPVLSGSGLVGCGAAPADGAFPGLSTDIAWVSGFLDQKILILRRRRLTVAVLNETGQGMDMVALTG